MQDTQKFEKRKNGRISETISAVVKAKKDEQQFWKQNADVISISRTGAGFYLETECRVGQLVSMLMPMPRHLRCYDWEKEYYRVWGLVQHCSRLIDGDGTSYHIGVAFVGRNVPESYHQNPTQSYRITGINEEGLWKIIEAKSEFVRRRHYRHWVSLEVSLSTLDADGKTLELENTFTENVSPNGAAVFTTSSAKVGDAVKFKCRAHNFSTLAVVRNRQEKEMEVSKLHLEFIENVFPVTELIPPIEVAPKD